MSVLIFMVRLVRLVSGLCDEAYTPNHKKILRLGRLGIGVKNKILTNPNRIKTVWLGLQAASLLSLTALTALTSKIIDRNVIFEAIP